MTREQRMVYGFHVAMNELIARDRPRNAAPRPVDRPPGIRDAELRAALVMEEARETAEALTGRKWVARPATDNDFRTDRALMARETPERSLVAVADGCADLQVVTLGTVVDCGFDLEPVFDEVMRTNDAKVTDGAWFRDDGKMMKPAGWRAPDVGRILREQGWDGKS